MISFIRNRGDAFNLGCFIWRWRLFGPFMLYREMLSCEGTPPPLTGWRLAIFFSDTVGVSRRDLLAEFYEGASK